MQMKRRGVALALSGLLALSAAVGARMPEQLLARPLAEMGDSTETLSRAFRTASQRAQPSLVHIRVERAAAQMTRALPEGFEGTPFEDFFKGRSPRGMPSPPQHASGSGFIFSADGHVLTNNHVVADGRQITVVLNDGREFAAELVGRDPNTDVAVLKIDAKDLPRAVIGDADRIEVGDWVVALGYPMQLGPTVTAGIVSAKGRSLGIIAQNDDAQAPLEHFIQTDAAINPGNSGGPLVDLQGRVIGMNTAIASPTGYYSGYGFAVPINLVMRVASDLIRFGEVRRPKLGVGVSNVSPTDAEVYQLAQPHGAEVTQVTPGSPAEQAGLKLGDIILSINGNDVADSGELTEQLARLRPGQSIELVVHRYGKRMELDARLGMFEPTQRNQRAEAQPAESGAGRLGFKVSQSDGKVVIAGVEPGSPAARAGLASGLVLEQFNQQPVDHAADVVAAADAVRAGGVVSLIVRDAEGQRTIVNFRAPN